METIKKSSLINDLKKIYASYGFSFAKEYHDQGVIVFTIKTGYFDNADIVSLVNDSNTEKAFDDFTELGFACTVRQIRSELQAQQQLFNGFFSVDSIKNKLASEYEKFTNSIVKPYSANASYRYINTPYTVNGLEGSKTPYDEVINKLHSPKPTLFLIEAAAGFGKTCTAYELVQKIISDTNYLPLFSELSRNREARIFKYILLDEIDTSFPTLSSKLVQLEIKSGRVITVLDGFDELLRKTEESDEFETQEPMLETIGEFLTGSAKIVLTTRKTVLFEGDAFHEWVQRHVHDFELITIKLSEPRVIDWLEQRRLDQIRACGLNVDHIANPVLLSYLRCIEDDEFQLVTEYPEAIVESYFNFMLERERNRQDLRLSIEKQHEVLKSICLDMIHLGYTTEYRDYIVDQILAYNSKIIDESLSNYAASERPTREEIANKLASHALLDRSSREPNKIGFINEFVLGNYVGKIVLDANDWLNDDLRFIDPLVTSFKARSIECRIDLWKKLKNSVEFLPCSNQIYISTQLLNKIEFELKNNEAEGITFESILIGELKIADFQFNECSFHDCTFNLKNLSNVTFLNCKFYGNEFLDGQIKANLYVLGGFGDTEFIKALREAPLTSNEIETTPENAVERFILEKFWPTGKENVLHKHRPIKSLCLGNDQYKPNQLFEAIENLKRRKILQEPRSVHFVEINFDEINEIRRILGRGIGQ